jgi:hypothetical protein
MSPEMLNSLGKSSNTLIKCFAHSGLLIKISSLISSQLILWSTYNHSHGYKRHFKVAIKTSFLIHKNHGEPD